MLIVHFSKLVRACKVPDLPFGAYVISQIKPAYKTGDRITLGCKKGLKKKGNSMRICISGRWTAFPFKCEGEVLYTPRKEKGEYDDKIE